MDPDALPRGGIALRAGDFGVGRALQKPRCVERGHRVLHRLAVFAVGHQTVVESGRGYFKNTPAMDLGDAIFFGRDARRDRPDDSRAAFFPAHPRLFLAGGVQFGNA